MKRLHLVGLLWISALATPATALCSDPLERSVLAMINAERQAHHLPPVSSEAVLHEAAQWMAEDLARRGMLDHTDSRQRDTATRVQSFGYRHPRVLAENIAEGQDRPEDVVASWLQSPGHRANILNKDVSQAGVGHARTSTGDDFWVLDLGQAMDRP